MKPEQGIRNEIQKVEKIIGELKSGQRNDIKEIVPNLILRNEGVLVGLRWVLGELPEPNPAPPPDAP